jgi:hypothetical protein
MIASQYVDSKYRLGNQGEGAGPWLLGIVKEALMHPDYLRQPDTTMPNDNEDVCFPSTQKAIMSSSSRQRRVMESLGQ